MNNETICCGAGERMLTTTTACRVTWELPPDDFVFPDDPVDNINQPLLAAALTESLELAGRIPANALVTTNYGICATVNGNLVVKAPDWCYIPEIRVPRSEVERSYTPQLQGEIPLIAIEFLSEAEGSEYSTKPTYPPGKWFFYEQVLQIPNYVIFDLKTGVLEAYRLDETGRYDLQGDTPTSRYWIPELNLFLGVWQGSRENRTGNWLRWWNEQEELLLWGTELLEQERQRSERLIAQLRAAGLEPEV